MAIIYAGTKDGQAVNLVFGGTWEGCRDATASTYALTGGRAARDAVATLYLPKGAGLHVISRTFLDFNTISISVEPTAVSLFLKTRSNNGASFFVLDHIDRPLAWGTTDFDTIGGWNATGANADGDGAGDNESLVTKLSAEVTSIAADGSYTEIPLLPKALAIMKDEDYLKVALVESVHDLRDEDNGLDASTFQTGFYFSDSPGTSNNPYIEYTPAVSAADNATFFGANF